MALRIRISSARTFLLLGWVTRIRDKCPREGERLLNRKRGDRDLIYVLTTTPPNNGD